MSSVGGKGKVAAAFIPVVLNEPEDNDMPEKEKKDTPEWKKSRGFTPSVLFYGE